MQLLRIAYVRFVANSFPHTRRNFYYFCIILENERLNFYLLHLIHLEVPLLIKNLNLKSISKQILIWRNSALNSNNNQIYGR